MAKDYAKHRSQRNQPRRRKVKSGNISPWIVTGILIGIVIAGMLYFKMKRAQMFNQQVIETNQPVQSNDKKTPPSTKTPEPHFDFYSVLSKDEKVATPEITNTVKKNTQVNPAELLPDVPVEEVVSPDMPPEAKPKVETVKENAVQNKPVEPPVTTVDIGEAVTERNKMLAEEKKRIEQEIAKAAQPVVHKESKASTGDSAKRYVLLLGAYKDHTTADELRAQFVLQGLDVNIKSIKKDGQTLYRLWMGPYTLKMAQQQQQRLQSDQIKSVVTKES